MMGSESNAEEVRQQYLRAMGPELGEIYFRLWNECVSLHWKWEEYVALFGTTPERIELLNRSAPSFFRVVQDTLWESILLHIARLTDPPQSVGKDNLTIRRLPTLVHDHIRANVDVLLETCAKKSEFARDWRKRWIAHKDLKLALDHPTAAPLASASRQAVKDCLSAIATLLNAVELHYRGSEVFYELRPHGNAEALFHVLWNGIEAEARRRERIRSGEFGMEDLKRRPSL